MRLSWLTLSLAVGWGAALGCREDAPKEQPDGEAGAAGAPVMPVEGGGAGGGGAEPIGGGGSSGAGGAESCEAPPLECDECPTLDELRDACALAYGVSCERLLVEPTPQLNPSGRTRYCFDGDGLLVGREFENELGNRQIVGADCGSRLSGPEPFCSGGGGAAGAAGAAP